MREAPEKPRMVSSFDGSDTIRLPLLRRSESLLSSARAGLTGNRASESCTFLKSSEDCRNEGLMSRTRERGKNRAWCRLSTAVVVLLPDCLQQLSKSRLLRDCNTCSCQGSG